jgi:hypothetical protein
MLVNFRVGYDVEMIRADRISVRDFGLTDSRSADPERSNHRWGALGQLRCARNETSVLRRFNNAIGVLNRMLADESVVGP